MPCGRVDIVLSHHITCLIWMHENYKSCVIPQIERKSGTCRLQTDMHLLMDLQFELLLSKAGFKVTLA